jgi:hypothetical protein
MRLQTRDHKNAQAFVVNKQNEPGTLVADFYYDFGVPKSVIRKAVGAFIKTINKNIKERKNVHK